MQELYDKIKNTVVMFDENAVKCLGGNKSAGVRSRQASLELDKLLKEWRKASVKGE